MFVVSFKPSLKKFCVYLVSIVIILGSIAVLNRQAEPLAQTAAAAKSVSTNDQRLQYIKQFGWVVENEPCEIVDIHIPKDFNDVYQKYNKLQKKQGFNLEKVKGKVAKRYSYTVLNYKSEPEYVRVNLIVCDNIIIASDICSLKLDGFMHGLNENKNAVKG